MGVYVTQSDLTPSHVSEKDLVQLTQDDPTSDTVDAEVLESVILDAEAELDGYLGARYALPLATVPRFIRQIAARLTNYRLHRRRDASIGEDLQKDHDAAIRLLEQIAAGTVTLGVQPEAGENPQRIIQSTSHERVFGRTNLEDY